MKNDGIVISLMNGGYLDVPSCVEGEHQFYIVEEPDSHGSGWMKQRCGKCGVVTTCDTAD
jgi:hypothetical protein